MIVEALHFLVHIFDIRLHSILFVAHGNRAVLLMQTEKCPALLGKVHSVMNPVDKIIVPVRGKANDSHYRIVIVLFLFGGRVNDYVDVHFLSMIFQLFAIVPDFALLRLASPITKPLFLEALGIVGKRILKHLAGEGENAHSLSLLGKQLLTQQHRLPVRGAVHRCRVDSRDDRFALHHGRIGVVGMVARSDIALRATAGTQVEG